MSASPLISSEYTTPLPKSVTIAPVSANGEVGKEKEWFPVEVIYSRSRGWEFTLASSPNGAPERVCHAPSFQAGGAESSGQRIRYCW